MTALDFDALIAAGLPPTLRRRALHIAEMHADAPFAAQLAKLGVSP